MRFKSSVAFLGSNIELIFVDNMFLSSVTGTEGNKLGTSNETNLQLFRREIFLSFFTSSNEFLID